MPFPFAGFREFVARAAAALELSRPCADEVERSTSLKRLAGLIGSAASQLDTPQGHAAALANLTEAVRSRDALVLAAAAGQAMLDHACAGLDIPRFPMPGPEPVPTKTLRKAHA